jgi:hypothetical protein
MNQLFDMPESISAVLQKTSATQLLNYLSRLVDGGVDISKAHPLLAMLSTTRLRTEIVIKDKSSHPGTANVLNYPFIAATDLTLRNDLISSTKKKKSDRLTALMIAYFKHVSVDFMRKQLAYHSWASADFDDTAAAFTAMVPANKDIRVILPYSLLVTPSRPVIFLPSDKTLRTGEINDTVVWLRSMKIASLDLT